MMFKKTESKIDDPRLLRVLMVEDSEDDELLIIRALKKGGYNPVYDRVETAEAMRKALQDKNLDVILCDYKLPKFNAPSAIAVLKETNIDIPLIIISGAIGEETAAECMRLGAHDYIIKNNLSRLCPAVARELKETEVRIQRKRADEALQESEKKYHDLYDFLPIPIYEMDFEANITSANRAIYETFRGTEEDLKIGFKGWQLLSPEEADKSAKNIQRLLKGEQVKGTEYNLRRLDGSVFPGIVISSVIYSNGKPVGLRGAIVDISQRKQVEEALQESEEKYRNLFENVNEAIFVAQDGKVVFFNPMALMLLGHDGAEFASRPFIDFIHPDDRDMVIDRHFRRLKGEDIPRRYSFRLIYKDGGVRWVDLDTVLIKWEGKPATLNFMNDIT